LLSDIKKQTTDRRKKGTACRRQLSHTGLTVLGRKYKRKQINTMHCNRQRFVLCNNRSDWFNDERHHCFADLSCSSL